MTTDQSLDLDRLDLDRTRRYLVPVARLELAGHPYDTHLSVYEWLPGFEAWATGPAICGISTSQGPLPEGTEATCAGCLKRQEDYERYLTPGYRPEDDDPKVLRARAEKAERKVEQAKALVAKWQKVAVGRDDAVILVGVAADVLLATLDGVNDLLSEAGR